MSSRSVASTRADVYTRITAEIIAAVEAGAGECRMPWHHDGASSARPTNVASGRRYRGINTLVLWAAAARAGYTQADPRAIFAAAAKAQQAADWMNAQQPQAFLPEPRSPGQSGPEEEKGGGPS